MPLSTSIPLADGTSSNYFVIQRLDLLPLAQTGSATVFGYFSLAAFNANCSQNYSVSIPFTYAEIGNNVSDVTLSEVYAFLQTQPQFTGATVV